MELIKLFVLYVSLISSSHNIPLEANKQIYCLAHAVYHEARGEPIEGQMAVAQVVMNRVNSARYPDTVCEVVYQERQFTDIKKTKPNTDTKYWTNSVEIATLTYLGFISVDFEENVMHYYNPDKVVRRPTWCPSDSVVTKIGQHKFCRVEK